MAVEVWGIAAGCGSTKQAAPGALTVLEYASRLVIPRRDWRQVLRIRKVPDRTAK